MCIDGDNHLTGVNVVAKWKRTNQLVVFPDTTDKSNYSYVQLDAGACEQDRRIVEIREKVTGYAPYHAHTYKNRQKNAYTIPLPSTAPTQVKINHLACAGSYGFDSWKKLRNACAHVIQNNIRGMFA
jgi:hypothetical protein